MSASLQHQYTRYDLAAPEDRTALSHHEFILSSRLTATLIQALASGHTGDILLPQEDPETEQFYISDLSASRVRKALWEIGFNIADNLRRMLEAAERLNFLINVDHGFINTHGGAISRAISPDEW